MKTNNFLCDRLLTADPQQNAPSIQQQSELLRIPTSGSSRDRIRHILLGSPGSIRQTIHLLHTLGYSETLLWSPIATVEDSIVITPAQGKAMSLLIRQI
jgi:hypothetical protein